MTYRVRFKDGVLDGQEREMPDDHMGHLLDWIDDGTGTSGMVGYFDSFFVERDERGEVHIWTLGAEFRDRDGKPKLWFGDAA